MRVTPATGTTSSIRSASGRKTSHARVSGSAMPASMFRPSTAPGRTSGRWSACRPRVVPTPPTTCGAPSRVRQATKATREAQCTNRATSPSGVPSAPTNETSLRSRVRASHPQAWIRTSINGAWVRTPT